MLTIVVASALVVYGIRQSQTPSVQVLHFKTVFWSEFGSALVPHAGENFVINDNDTWSKVYAEDICGNVDPCVPAPLLNFTSSTVLAVFAGYKPIAGYLINITQVNQTGQSIIIETRLTLPMSPDASDPCIAAEVPTYPFHVVTIPKTALSVAFKAGPVIQTCHHPLQG